MLVRLDVKVPFGAQKSGMRRRRPTRGPWCKNRAVVDVGCVRENCAIQEAVRTSAYPDVSNEIALQLRGSHLQS